MDSTALEPFTVRILSDLAPFLESTTEDTLTLIVETLTATVKINLGSWLTPDTTRPLAQAILGAWRKHCQGMSSTIVLSQFLTGNYSLHARFSPHRPS